MASEITPLWINGERRVASDGATYEVRNSLSGQVVGIAASASSKDCEEAVAAAAKAFDSWEKTSLSAKQAIFLKFASLSQSDEWKAKLSKAMKDETAYTDLWAFVNIRALNLFALEAASMVSAIKGSYFPSTNAPGGHVVVQRRAHGVCLGMAPWNASIALIIRAVLPALACGNTVVAKSSELSPKSQELVIELLHEAGIPPGVVNLVSTSKESAPARVSELIANPDVRHINFTGSDRVGRILATEAGKHLKPCVFELGGKAPAVILEDADLEAAARCVTAGALFNSGQVCMSTERIIVQRSVSQQFIPLLKSHFEKLRAGHPQNDKTPLSALVAESFAEGVVNMIKEAESEGATLLVGDGTRNGAIVQPHLIAGYKPGMKIWNKESFGPIVGITEVDTVDEAVELANSTDYSLSACVWTRDVNRALDVASRIRSGNTSINGSTFHSELREGEAGLGGATGYGRFDIENFTVKRIITIHPPDAKYPLVG